MNKELIQKVQQGTHCIRKRDITDLPSEKGWYLIQAPNNHPVNVGRAFFNGKNWQWSGTVKNYVAQGCTLQWLEELSSTEVFPSDQMKQVQDDIDSVMEGKELQMPLNRPQFHEGDEILQQLVRLKKHRDAFGKDKLYEQEKEEAWQRAFKYIDKIHGK